MGKKQVDPANALVVKRTDYVQALDSISAGGFCPFCEEHLFKHHSRPLILKGRHWLVTENAWPYKGARLHFLIISRVHIEKTEDLSAAMWADLHKTYWWLTQAYRFKGATLFIRSGETKLTGATVNHLHAQLLVGSPRTRKTKPIKALVGFAK